MTSKKDFLKDSETDELYDWLNTIELSKPKKNLARDFSDGLLFAEIVKNFHPRLVELHNYSPANAFENKMINWTRLNEKVLSQLGIQQTPQALKNIAGACKGSIESLLYRFKKRTDELNEKRNQSNNEILTLEEYYLHHTVPIEDYSKLEDKLRERHEDIANLNAKVHHLETLAELKDQRIRDLTSQLKRCVCQRPSSPVF